MMPIRPDNQMETGMSEKTVADRVVELLSERGPMSGKQLSRSIGSPNLCAGKAFKKLLSRGEISGELSDNPLYAVGEKHARVKVMMYQIGQPMTRENRARRADHRNGTPSKSIVKAIKLLERHGYRVEKVDA